MPNIEYRGRRKPYTLAGLRRVPCARCGRPSTSQWNACANGNRYLGCCDTCDIMLNWLVLKFFKFDKVDLRIRRYKESR